MGEKSSKNWIFGGIGHRRFSDWGLSDKGRHKASSPSSFPEISRFWGRNSEHSGKPSYFHCWHGILFDAPPHVWFVLRDVYDGCACRLYSRAPYAIKPTPATRKPLLPLTLHRRTFHQTLWTPIFRGQQISRLRYQQNGCQSKTLCWAFPAFGKSFVCVVSLYGVCLWWVSRVVMEQFR